MIGIGCPDEIIVGNSQFGPQSPELRADLVGILLGRYTGFARRFRNLIAMFIGTGYKKSFSSLIR